MDEAIDEVLHQHEWEREYLERVDDEPPEHQDRRRDDGKNAGMKAADPVFNGAVWEQVQRILTDRTEVTYNRCPVRNTAIRVGDGFGVVRCPNSLVTVIDLHQSGYRGPTWRHSVAFLCKGDVNPS